MGNGIGEFNRGTLFYNLQKLTKTTSPPTAQANQAHFLSFSLSLALALWYCTPSVFYKELRCIFLSRFSLQILSSYMPASAKFFSWESSNILFKPFLLSSFLDKNLANFLFSLLLFFVFSLLGSLCCPPQHGCKPSFSLSSFLCFFKLNFRS